MMIKKETLEFLDLMTGETWSVGLSKLGVSRPDQISAFALLEP